MKFHNEITIPAWLLIKIEQNDQTLNDAQYRSVNYYYKQLTNTKLKERCQNCIADAFIIFKIYLKQQK